VMAISGGKLGSNRRNIESDACFETGEERGYLHNDHLCRACLQWGIMRVVDNQSIDMPPRNLKRILSE